MGKRDHRRRGAKTGATARAGRSETVDVYVNPLDDRADPPGYSPLAANTTLVVDIGDPCWLDRLTTPARPG